MKQRPIRSHTSLRSRSGNVATPTMRQIRKGPLKAACTALIYINYFR